MIEIKIKTEYITLGQFLKFSGIITNGCEAKVFIENNNIFIDDILEKRRGRKIYKNSLIKVEEKVYKII